MGQLGFIFFSIMGIWVAKDGVEVAQLAQTLVPLLAEVDPALAEWQSETFSALVMDLLSKKLAT